MEQSHCKSRNIPQMALAIALGRDTSQFFPRARAKGSCCLRLPLGVWIELATMPERGGPIEKSKENLRFFRHFRRGGFKNQRFFNLLALKASKTKGFSMVLGSGRAHTQPGPGLGQGRSWEVRSQGLEAHRA